MSEALRTTTETVVTDAKLLERLGELMTQYRPTQFAALWDEGSKTWAISYPNGQAAKHVEKLP